MNPIFFDSDLTPSDAIVLRNLSDHISRYRKQPKHELQASKVTGAAGEGDDHVVESTAVQRDASDLAILKSLNDPTDKNFEPSILTTLDARDLPSCLPTFLYRWLFRHYLPWARKTVRHEIDVVMLTHLLLYFTTSVPSAALLFYRFSYLHGVLHLAMQFYYMGTYTLMMHQHIHMGGILGKTPVLRIIDILFPYIIDPLMGHTWNSYYYHHVKHHHVERNGPGDLSSTMPFQRDSPVHFLYYIGRFVFLIWLDLPLYFVRKRRPEAALKSLLWEISTYAMLYASSRLNRNAALFVFVLPLLLIRLGLMVGNWGQHAFVDADEPDSDFRSSITLIDVSSNRFCFNDGYHTSHHLNPLRHWREHPVSFLQQKQTYATEHALVFHNISYFSITFRLLLKDYTHLAQCLVPIGAQVDMTMEERIAMLKSHTRRFTEEEIRGKFCHSPMH